MAMAGPAAAVALKVFVFVLMDPPRKLGMVVAGRNSAPERRFRIMFSP
jgi:hypothetical protein